MANFTSLRSKTLVGWRRSLLLTVNVRHLPWRGLVVRLLVETWKCWHAPTTLFPYVSSSFKSSHGGSSKVSCKDWLFWRICQCFRMMSLILSVLGVKCSSVTKVWLRFGMLLDLQISLFAPSAQTSQSSWSFLSLNVGNISSLLFSYSSWTSHILLILYRLFLRIKFFSILQPFFKTLGLQIQVEEMGFFLSFSQLKFCGA